MRLTKRTHRPDATSRGLTARRGSRIFSRRMNWAILGALLVVMSVLLVVERLGWRTTLQLGFRGDIKREAAFLAQYGQVVCTPIVALLVWQLDPRRWRAAAAVALAVGGTAALGLVLKRLFGRVRRNREHAGRFLGPMRTHAGYRESFPSNHSAAAVALSTVLARFYPRAALTFWALALATAVLRYLLDAHWPSDVVAGAVMGYTVAHAAMYALGL